GEEAPRKTEALLRTRAQGPLRAADALRSLLSFRIRSSRLAAQLENRHVERADRGRTQARSQTALRAGIGGTFVRAGCGDRSVGERRWSNLPGDRPEIEAVRAADFAMSRAQIGRNVGTVRFSKRLGSSRSDFGCRRIEHKV